MQRTATIILVSGEERWGAESVREVILRVERLLERAR